jgi:Uma2 family endonuclease
MHDTFREPRVLRWSREDYYRLCEAEWFAGRRVELIDGAIIEIPAQSNHHFIGIQLVCDALQSAFGPDYWVRRGTLDLLSDSSPDPDIAVVPGSFSSYRKVKENPTTALLIVEVSELTLAQDRGVKCHLYAASGIADYWVLNIPDRQLEVYRDPVPDASEAFGWRYDQVTVLHAGDTVSPLALPAAQIPVADLMP